MINFYKVSKIYSPDIMAVKNVSFRIGEKEFISIVGKSGAGKTTLLKLLLRQEEVSKGRIFFEEQDISKIKNKDLPWLRKRIGTVFQDYKLLDSKTLFENMAYVMEVMGRNEALILKEVPQVLEIVGLSDRANHFVEQLSHGERQRAGIARALVARPDVILADEPTGNLDPYHTRDVIQLLLRINEMGTTVILATHNKDIINNLGKRVITLEEGKIVRDENPGRFIL